MLCSVQLSFIPLTPSDPGENPSLQWLSKRLYDRTGTSEEMHQNERTSIPLFQTLLIASHLTTSNVTNRTYYIENTPQNGELIGDMPNFEPS